MDSCHPTRFADTKGAMIMGNGQWAMTVSFCLISIFQVILLQMILPQPHKLFLINRLLVPIPTMRIYVCGDI